jgi:hypothetical protein
MKKPKITICATLPRPLVEKVDDIWKRTPGVTSRTGALIRVLEAGLERLREQLETVAA